jgi:hypothetical protein
MVRTAPSMEYVKRCYSAMNGGTGESYTIPRKKKTSTIVNEDSFLTFDGDSEGFLDERDYRCANWVYVVLSRLRTRKGLFLTKPLDLDREFNVPQSLIDFENRIRTNLEQPTLDKLAQKGHYRTGGTRNAE